MVLAVPAEDLLEFMPGLQTIWIGSMKTLRSVDTGSSQQFIVAFKDGWCSGETPTSALSTPSPVSGALCDLTCIGATSLNGHLTRMFQCS